jgi:putative ABC transport system permease protein
MKVLKLIFRNSLRHKLRTLLTILGLALAVMAFGLIRTFINVWYSGVDTASPNRLVTRHAVSIVFFLPLAYKEQLQKTPGVEEVSYADWFGGIYIDPKNFFAQFAVDHTTFFDLYPEFIVPPSQFEDFSKERKAVVVGRRLADRFGWKIGDPIILIGTIFPGNWDFVIRGIYSGRDKSIDENSFILRYDYLDESLKQTSPRRAGRVGWYGLKISDSKQAAQISATIDAHFKNSLAETKTETEKEFQISFIAMASAIITGLRIISYLIIGVILLVLANTMAMTARERVSEHAFLKTLGFRGYHLVGLIFGESLSIATIGGLFGICLLAVTSRVVEAALVQFFPSFAPSIITYIASLGVAMVVGVAAAIFPVQRAIRIRIVDGLRVVD